MSDLKIDKGSVISVTSYELSDIRRDDAHLGWSELKRRGKISGRDKYHEHITLDTRHASDIPNT